MSDDVRALSLREVESKVEAPDRLPGTESTSPTESGRHGPCASPKYATASPGDYPSRSFFLLCWACCSSASNQPRCVPSSSKSTICPFLTRMLMEFSDPVVTLIAA